MRFAGQNIIPSFMDEKPMNFTNVADKGLAGMAQERIAGVESLSQVGSYGLSALANLASAEFGADAARAQGQAAGQSAMVDGLMGGIGSFGSSLIKGLGNKKPPIAPDAGDAMDGGGILPLTVGDEKPWGYYPGEY